MVSVKGRFEYSDGLTPGQSKYGGIHHNLYDEQGHLVGHGTFFPDDEDGSPTGMPSIYSDGADEYASDEDDDDLAEIQKIVAALVVLGTLKAVEKAAPHLRKWWRDQALPFVKSARKRLARVREGDGAQVENLIECVPSMLVDAPPESSGEVVAALEEYRAGMSGTEARERFVAALTAGLLSEKARLYSEGQMRVLLNARIEDAELKSVLETVTPEQVADGIKLMLEANPSLLDEFTARGRSINRGI
ncbi:hypothetical protein [Actinomadura monticuli]|uniref:Uncharacterized protein n=1 Tax=Actinomadura monticuli TaxID=3097367 RepID=A0ABV4QDU0_9ACTN